MKNLLRNSGFILKVILSLFFALISKDLLAFNWDNCSSKVFYSGNGVGMFTSTSSYLSSTGPCSMLGRLEIEKKHFIVHSYEPLKNDLARGDGEYLYAYAELSGCPINIKKEYSGYLQRNFIKIYGAKLNNTPAEIYYNIEKVIKGNKKLLAECSILEII